MNATSDKIRPLELKRDLDALVGLIEIAFAGDLARWGSDFGEQVKMMKKFVPLIRFLSRVSEAFRNTFDGFLWEEEGRVVGGVTVSKQGLNRARWLIGNVATHPDFRRRGIARALVNRAIQHAQAHGAEMCILEVRAEAEPAYNLYRSMDFVHYDSVTGFKLEALPEAQVKPFDGYDLRPMKFTEWQPRYELAVRETPQEVQDFAPVSEAEFRVVPIERLIQPLALRLQRTDIHRWAVEKEGRLVGYASLAACKAPKVNHRLFLRIEPEHQEALADPLVSLTLHTLQDYPPNNFQAELRTTNTGLIDTLKRYGFEEIEVMHRLGLKLGSSG